MKKCWVIIALILLASLILFIGLRLNASQAQPSIRSTSSTAAVPTATPAVNLANPASQNCFNVNGKLTIKTAADGSQTGFCTLPTGKECEEWALYRGECK